MKNFKLKVVDLSHNQLGLRGNCIEEFLYILNMDYKHEMVHLDLSFNKFPLD